MTIQIGSSALDDALLLAGRGHTIFPANGKVPRNIVDASSS